jgi:hypothetical protein
MKRLIIQTRKFSVTLDELIRDRKITKIDFEEFERIVVCNPEDGDLIQGTGGLRKTRLRSASRGKSGGFRVCYCDVKEKGKLFLIAIYAKNVKETLSKQELSILQSLVDRLKKE